MELHPNFGKPFSKSWLTSKRVTIPLHATGGYVGLGVGGRDGASVVGEVSVGSARVGGAVGFPVGVSVAPSAIRLFVGGNVGRAVVGAAVGVGGPEMGASVGGQLQLTKISVTISHF